MFLPFKLIFETYIVTATPEIVFKIHISICVFLNNDVLPYSNEVDQDISQNPSPILGCSDKLCSYIIKSVQLTTQPL